MKTVPSFRSPILQRVQRHQRMAILFRYAAQAHEPQPVWPTAITDTLAHASIVLPTRILTPAFLSATTAQADAPPSPHQVAAPMPGHPAAPAPAAGAQPASAGQETGNEITGKEWQRLEAIFRKHQERAMAGEQPGAPEGQAASDLPEAPIQPAEIERPSAAPDSGPQRRHQDDLHGKQPPEVQPRQAGVEPLRVSPPPPRGGQPIQLIPETRTQPAPQALPAVRVAAPLLEEQPPLARMERAPDSGGLPVVPEPSGVAEAGVPGFPIQARSEADEIAPPEDEPEGEHPPRVPGLHPLPLQSVWPVQRRQTPQRPEPGKSAPPASSLADTSGQENFLTLPAAVMPPNDFEPPGEILRQVSPVRPTGSSIEVIPPRRPRPDGPEAAGTAGAADDAVQDAVQVEAAPIHRDAQTGEISLPQSHRLAVDAETLLAAGRQQSQSVPTEIGPLPGDLWRLIGEVPPTPLAAPAPARAAREQPDRKEVVMRKSSPEQPEAAHPIQPAAPVMFQASPAPQSSPPFEQKPEDMTGGSAEVEFDVDELARRVYAEIRRRISIEWERRR